MTRSPLRFIVLIAVMAEAVAAGALINAQEQQQIFLIVFLVVFPVAILGVIFGLIWFSPHKLYAPSDFATEDSFLRSLERLPQSASDKIKAIVTTQVELLSTYHDVILKNGKRSFQSALTAAFIGIVFFVISVLFVMLNQPDNAALITVISGALVEVIAGINFYLYGKASAQMAKFQNRLERIQRFILADSMCDSLDEGVQQRTRSLLVCATAGVDSSELVSVLLGERSTQQSAGDDAGSRAPQP